jgi:pimeloyl-ACP methyl ester carboxylesterase
VNEERAPSALRRAAEVGTLVPRAFRSFGHLGPRGPEGAPPALVIPGFIATDRTTMELRRALGEAGLRVHPWRQGLNLGAREDTLERLDHALDQVADERPAVLVGWSLGGLFAREFARHRPERVRAVVTMGSPVWGDPRQFTNVWKLYERIAGHPVDAPPIPRVEDKPPVPTLALWSARDGIVAPCCARGAEGTCDKAVEVPCNHMGFAVSRRGSRAAAAEIVRFLEELDGSGE